MYGNGGDGNRRIEETGDDAGLDASPNANIVIDGGGAADGDVEGMVEPGHSKNGGKYFDLRMGIVWARPAPPPGDSQARRLREAAAGGSPHGALLAARVAGARAHQGTRR